MVLPPDPGRPDPTQPDAAPPTPAPTVTEYATGSDAVLHVAERADDLYEQIQGALDAGQQPTARQLARAIALVAKGLAIVAREVYRNGVDVERVGRGRR